MHILGSFKAKHTSKYTKNNEKEKSDVRMLPLEGQFGRSHHTVIVLIYLLNLMSSCFFSFALVLCFKAFRY